MNGDALDELDETFGVTLSNPSNATIADGSGSARSPTTTRLRPCRSATSPSPKATPAPRPRRSPSPSRPRAGRPSPFDWRPPRQVPPPRAPTTRPRRARCTFAAGSHQRDDRRSPSTATSWMSSTRPSASSCPTPSNATIADGSGHRHDHRRRRGPRRSRSDDVSVTEGNAGTDDRHVHRHPVRGQRQDGHRRTGRPRDDDAVQPADYTAGVGTLTFVPGDTSETFAVTVNGDLVAELDETSASRSRPPRTQPWAMRSARARSWTTSSSPWSTSTNRRSSEGQSGTANAQLRGDPLAPVGIRP